MFGNKIDFRFLGLFRKSLDNKKPFELLFGFLKAC